MDTESRFNTPDLPQSILLVEDEAIIALHEAQMLEKRGYRVRTASNPETALSLAVEAETDLVLMDIDLGKGRPDGAETARKILEVRAVPIVFLSSHTEAEIVDKTEAIASYGYVVKNSAITVLDASIRMAWRLFTAKRQIEHHERRFALATRGAQTATWLVDLTTLAIDVDHTWEELTGYRAEKGRMMVSMLFEIIHPEDRPRIEKQWSAHATGAQSRYSAEYRIRRKTGEWIWVRDDGEIIEYARDGSPLVAAGTQRDITRQKQLDGDVRGRNKPPGQTGTPQQREDYLRTLFNIAPDAILLADRTTGRVIDANPAAAELFEIEFDELIGKHQSELHPPEETSKAERAFKNRSVGANEPARPVEIRIVTGAGTTKTVEIRGTVVDFDDSPCVLGFFRDISARRAEAEAVREAQERYQLLSDLTVEGIVVHQNGYVINANLSAENIVGYTVEELVGRQIIPMLIHPDDIPIVHENMSKSVAGPYEVRGITKSGGIVPIEIESRDFTMNGEVFRVAAVRDIRARKEMAEALQNSLVDLTLAQAIGKFGHWQYDPEIARITWSDEIYRMYNRAPQEGPLPLAEYASICSPEQLQQLRDAFGSAVDEGTPYDLDIRLELPNRGSTWFRTICHPEANRGPKGHFLRGIIQDITDRKEREKALQNLIDEKELLIKEIDHRVKNNLAIVQSLISLKDRDIGPSVDLADLHNQIEAIRTVHEHLYKRDSVTHVEMHAYMRSLLGTIFTPRSGEAITIHNRVTETALPSKTASTVGLIVNELATNAIKYSFTDSDTHEFSVSLERCDTHWVLDVAHSGRPLPDSIDLQNPTTLGLRLISALVGQLEGEIEIQRNPSPKFTIRFPGE